MNSNKPVTRKTCCWELNPLEKETLRAMFLAILELGRAPTIEELQLKMEKTTEEIIHILDELEQKDVLLRRKGTQEIVSIYPVSLTSTEHQVIFEDGKKLFAMCALDAVGIPSLFKINARVDSRCEWGTEKTFIEIRDEKIAAKSHPDILIWNTDEIIIPAAETCCPLMNFFCTEEHLKKWESKNSELSKIGQGILLEQAYPENKDRWKRYGEMIGIR
jgi:hypothetical protein